MTTAHHSLDLRAKALHEQALTQLSAPVLARLRQARRDASAAAPARAAWRPWLAGGGLAALLAVAVVLRPGDPVPAPAGTAAAVVSAEPAEPLQEDPGFYLWLASADAPLLALE